MFKFLKKLLSHKKFEDSPVPRGRVGQIGNMGGSIIKVTSN